MQEFASVLITLGGVMLLGMLTDLLGRHTPLPRVTLLLLFGLAIGPSGIALLPEIEPALFELLSVMALVMIGFLIGGTLTGSTLRRHGRRVLTISVAMVVATVAIVAGGLIALGRLIAESDPHLAEISECLDAMHVEADGNGVAVNFEQPVEDLIEQLEGKR